MTAARLPTEVRHAALVWAFQNLEAPLTAELLATMQQAHLARGAAARGLVPELEAVDVRRCQDELQALEHAGLLYRRRLGGYQLTEGGLVLGRAMAEAEEHARAAVQGLELSEQDRAYVATCRELEDEHEVVARASTMVPAALLEGVSPAELQALLERNLAAELNRRALLGGPLCPEDLLRGTGTGQPIGLTSSTPKPRRTP